MGPYTSWLIFVLNCSAFWLYFSLNLIFGGFYSLLCQIVGGGGTRIMDLDQYLEKMNTNTKII